MKNLIFLGAPGVGKGTMAEKLANCTKINHISTGAILREEIDNQTQLGLEAKEIMARGELVPDNVVAEIVAGKLATAEVRENGFILDGFPRTAEQAKILACLLNENNITVDASILFNVPGHILIQRLTGRRVCKSCGSTLHHVIFNPPKTENMCDKCNGTLYQREDDNEKTAIDRLEVYNKLTAPVIDFYKNAGKLISIDAEPAQNLVFDELKKTLKI